MASTSRRPSAAERAAELRADTERRERTRQFVVVGAILSVLVAIGVGTWFALSQGDTAGEAAKPPNGATQSYGLLVGDADAPDQVVIYEDFLCPACGALEAEVSAPLAAAVDEGGVSVEYRPVEILGRYGDYSMRSANAFAVVLDTSGPEAAREFHDLLFDNQPSESGPFPEDDELVELAVTAGADEADVRPGIEDLAFEQWVVNATDQASQDGLRGTPTVMINGETVESTELVELLG